MCRRRIPTILSGCRPYICSDTFKKQVPRKTILLILNKQIFSITLPFSLWPVVLPFPFPSPVTPQMLLETRLSERIVNRIFALRSCPAAQSETKVSNGHESTNATRFSISVFTCPYVWFMPLLDTHRAMRTLHGTGGCAHSASYNNS